MGCGASNQAYGSDSSMMHSSSSNADTTSALMPNRIALQLDNPKPAPCTDERFLRVQKAAEIGDLETLTSMCKELFTNPLPGVNINSQTKFGATLLFICCREGFVDGVKLLLQYNADPDIPSHAGAYPLHVCFVSVINVMSTAAAYREANRNNPAAHLDRLMTDSGARGRTEIVSLLYHCNADMNVIDLQGYTALMLGIQHNFTNAVKFLLDIGVAVDIQNDKGDTALIIASDLKKITAARMLITHGANVNMTNVIKNTSLHAACVRGSLPTVELLLFHGAEVNALNARRQSPLSFAAKHAPVEVIQKMVEHGGDLHLQSHQGDSPLMIVLDRPSIQVFWAKGADSDPIEVTKDGHATLLKQESQYYLFANKPKKPRVRQLSRDSQQQQQQQQQQSVPADKAASAEPDGSSVPAQSTASPSSAGSGGDVAAAS